VQKGEDDLAREALKRRKAYQVGGKACVLLRLALWPCDCVRRHERSTRDPDNSVQVCVLVER
jgi:hypothetical protein